MRGWVNELGTFPSQLTEHAGDFSQIPTARDHHTSVLVWRRSELDHGKAVDPRAHPGRVEPLEQRNDVLPCIACVFRDLSRE